MSLQHFYGASGSFARSYPLPLYASTIECQGAVATSSSGLQLDGLAGLSGQVLYVSGAAGQIGATNSGMLPSGVTGGTGSVVITDPAGMFSSIAGATAGYVLTSQGVGSDPAWQSVPVDIGATGTTGSIVTTNPAGIFSQLAPGATGTLIVSKGVAALPGYTNFGGVTNSILYVQNASGAIGAIGVTGAAGSPVLTNTAGVLSAVAAGATNAVLTYQGGASGAAWLSRARAGYGTTNITGQTGSTQTMVGLGSTFTLTPVVTGTVLVNANISLDRSSGADPFSVIIACGTGAAPAANTGFTGTTVGVPITMDSFAGGVQVALTTTSLFTGLSPGTAYWFDYQLTSGSVSGGVTILAANATLVEM